jgi:hypothetical protein
MADKPDSPGPWADGYVLPEHPHTPGIPWADGCILPEQPAHQSPTTTDVKSNIITGVGVVHALAEGVKAGVEGGGVAVGIGTGAAGLAIGVLILEPLIESMFSSSEPPPVHGHDWATGLGFLYGYSQEQWRDLEGGVSASPPPEPPPASFPPTDDLSSTVPPDWYVIAPVDPDPGMDMKLPDTPDPGMDMKLPDTADPGSDSSHDVVVPYDPAHDGADFSPAEPHDNVPYDPAHDGTDFSPAEPHDNATPDPGQPPHDDFDPPAL